MQIETTEEKVQEGLDAIITAGGTINNESQTAKIKGVTAEYGYNKEKGILTVNIIDKPWLATDSMIETEINKFFA